MAYFPPPMMARPPMMAAPPMAAPPMGPPPMGPPPSQGSNMAIILLLGFIIIITVVVIVIFMQSSEEGKTVKKCDVYTTLLECTEDEKCRWDSEFMSCYEEETNSLTPSFTPSAKLPSAQVEVGEVGEDGTVQEEIPPDPIPGMCSSFTCSPETILIATSETTECTDTCTQELCCEPKDTCETARGRGWQCPPETHVANTNTELCVGNECLVDECCDTRDTCEPSDCPAESHLFKTNTELCTGTECTVEECCDPRDTCEPSDCPAASHVSKTTTELCEGIQCMISECCDARDTCELSDCPAESHVAKTRQGLCPGSECTIDDCCDTRDTCQSSDCPSSTHILKSNPGLCSGSECTLNECCEPRGSCSSSSINCPYTTHESKTNPGLCTGTTCTMDECCDERSTLYMVSTDGVCRGNTEPVIGSGQSCQAATEYLQGLTPPKVITECPVNHELVKSNQHPHHSTGIPCLNGKTLEECSEYSSNNSASWFWFKNGRCCPKTFIGGGWSSHTNYQGGGFYKVKKLICSGPQGSIVDGRPTNNSGNSMPFCKGLKVEQGECDTRSGGRDGGPPSAAECSRRWKIENGVPKQCSGFGHSCTLGADCIPLNYLQNMGGPNGPAITIRSDQLASNQSDGTHGVGGGDCDDGDNPWESGDDCIQPLQCGDNTCRSYTTGNPSRRDDCCYLPCPTDVWQGSEDIPLIGTFDADNTPTGCKCPPSHPYFVKRPNNWQWKCSNQNASACPSGWQNLPSGANTSSYNANNTPTGCRCPSNRPNFQIYNNSWRCW